MPVKHRRHVVPGGRVQWRSLLLVPACIQARSCLTQETVKIRVMGPRCDYVALDCAWCQSLGKHKGSVVQLIRETIASYYYTLVL